MGPSSRGRSSGVGGAPTYSTRRVVAATMPKDSRHTSVQRRCDAKVDATIRSSGARSVRNSCSAARRAVRRAPTGGMMLAAATNAAIASNALLVVRAARTRRSVDRRLRSGIGAPACSWAGPVACPTGASALMGSVPAGVAPPELRPDLAR